VLPARAARETALAQDFAELADGTNVLLTGACRGSRIAGVGMVVKEVAGLTLQRGGVLTDTTQYG